MPSPCELDAKRRGKKFTSTSKLALLTEQKIAELSDRAHQGDNQAFRQLALIGSAVCRTLEEIGDKDLERLLVLTRSLPVWPVNIADVPNLPKAVNSLVTKLKIGQTTDEPYDVPRSRRKPSLSKSIAIKLVTIFESFVILCQADDVLGEAEAGVKHSDVQPPTLEDRHMLDLHREYLKKCHHSTSNLLTDFAKFLGVEDPYGGDKNAIFEESGECYSLRIHLRPSGPLQIEKCLEIFSKFAGPNPESIPALSKIANSKRGVSERIYGKSSEQQDGSNVRGGIKGEIKQAFEAICRQDGEFGRRRTVWGYLNAW